jgi:hypothetical protein
MSSSALACGLGTFSSRVTYFSVTFFCSRGDLYLSFKEIPTSALDCRELTETRDPAFLERYPTEALEVIEIGLSRSVALGDLWKSEAMS